MRVTVGQVPLRPLLVHVIDRVSEVNLDGYTSATFVLIDPNGQAVDTSGGHTSIVDGAVRYDWPLVTLFATPGDYRASLRLSGPTSLDFTEPGTIEAVREA